MPALQPVDAQTQEPAVQVDVQSAQIPLGPQVVSDVPPEHVLVARSQQPPWQSWVDEQVAVQRPLDASHACPTGHSVGDEHGFAGPVSSRSASVALSATPPSRTDVSRLDSYTTGASTTRSAAPVSDIAASMAASALESAPSPLPTCESRPPHPGASAAATKAAHLITF